MKTKKTLKERLLMLAYFLLVTFTLMLTILFTQQHGKRYTYEDTVLGINIKKVYTFEDNLLIEEIISAGTTNKQSSKYKIEDKVVYISVNQNWVKIGEVTPFKLVLDFNGDGSSIMTLKCSKNIKLKNFCFIVMAISGLMAVVLILDKKGIINLTPKSSITIEEDNVR